MYVSRNKRRSRSDISGDGHRQSQLDHGIEHSGTMQPADEQATPSTQAVCEPSIELTTELRVQYFQHLYPLPSYNFLHEPTIVRRQADNTLNEPLKLALCAVTTLLLGYHTAPHTQWIGKAESAIFAALHRPSMFHLQALLLIIRYHAVSGNFARAFMLAGLASRAAAGLRLHYEHAEMATVAQEMRRRTFWSLYLLDDLFCVGLEEYELCRPRTIHLQLPSQRETPSETEKAAYLDSVHSLEPEVLSCHGAILRLASMRRSIMKFVSSAWNDNVTLTDMLDRTSRRVLAKECGLRNLLQQVNSLQNELQQMKTQLREEDRYPPLDLQTFRWRPSYLMLHVAWHQCHCDLYRLFVSGYAEASPLSVLDGMDGVDQRTLRERCFKHADSIVQLIGEFFRQDSSIVLLELDIAVCAYHSARLILFGVCHLRKAETDALDKQRAIGRARLCLDFMDRFFATTMCSKPMVSSSTSRTDLTGADGV